MTISGGGDNLRSLLTATCEAIGSYRGSIADYFAQIGSLEGLKIEGVGQKSLKTLEEVLRTGLDDEAMQRVQVAHKV